MLLYRTLGTRAHACRWFLFCLLLSALAGPVSGDAPGESFDRIQLRMAGQASQPDSAIDGWGLDLGLSGYWTLVPGVVAELGLGRQQEVYNYGGNGSIGIVSQYGYYGARILVPPTQPLRFSAAARGFRGRLAVEDDVQWRSINYYWLEAGVHFSPHSIDYAVSATARQYYWADDTRDWRLTGEWLLPGAPWAWGLSAEYGMAPFFLELGVSLNHRF